MKVNIGRTIARERKSRGWTQSDFADRIGVSKAAVSKWELSQSFPDVPLLPCIAAIFGISLEDLFDCRAELTEEEQCALVGDVNLLLCRDFKQGMERCRELAREHATSGGLLIALATMLSSVTVARADEREDAFELAERLLDQADVLAGSGTCAQGATSARSGASGRGTADATLADRRTARLSAIARVSLLSLQGRTDEAVAQAERARSAVAGPDLETPVLASLYCQMGRTEDARRLHQESLFSSVHEVLASSSSLAQLCPDDPGRAVAMAEAARCVREAFGLADDPLSRLSRTYELASVRLASGAVSEAVDGLKAYVGGLEELLERARSGAPVSQPLPELFDLLDEANVVDKPLEGALLASVVAGLATNVEGDARWETADVDPRTASLRARLKAVRREASEVGERAS